MTTYIIRRSLQSLLILFLTSMVMYGILSINKCGPFCDLYGAQYPSPAVQKAVIERAQRKYGFDDPIPVRYLKWLYNWEPNDAVDPDLLQIRLNNFQSELASVQEPNRKAEVKAELQRLPKIIADTNAKLATCTNLLDFSKLGTCLSLQRQGGIISGNWGKSWGSANGQDVFSLIFGTKKLIAQRGTFDYIYADNSLLRGPLANTLVLMLFSIILALLLALPIGIFSAVKQYSIGDYTFTFVSFLGVGLPVFALAQAMLLMGRQGWLFDLPTAGVVDNPKDVSQYADLAIRLKHLILPGFILSFAIMAGFSRFIRSSMLEVLRLDYVRTAWAKGLHQRTVILKHALRNALIPLVTRIALAVPILLGGEIILSRIFGDPGIGGLFYSAALFDDWPLMMGLLIVGSVLIILSNFIADLAYALIDPRIRYN